MTDRIVDNRPGLVSLNAPAKVNLGLRIVGRRPDGFHLLESLFWPIDWEDTIELRPAPEFRLSVKWETEARGAEPSQDDNLVTKAFRRLFHGSLPQWEIQLTKRIPPMAGLGGGSSDAAAVVRYFGPELGMTRLRMTEVAAELGADVPYFLDPVPAWVEGIGERQMTLLSPPNFAFLLVIPSFGMRTAEVFRRYREIGKPFSESRKFDGDLRAYLANARNDLEEAAVSLEPRLGRILESLKNCGALYAGLSGSGSTCVAVFESPAGRENRTQGLDALLREASCRGVGSRRASWKSPK